MKIFIMCLSYMICGIIIILGGLVENFTLSGIIYLFGLGFYCFIIELILKMEIKKAIIHFKEMNRQEIYREK